MLRRQLEGENVIPESMNMRRTRNSHDTSSAERSKPVKSKLQRRWVADEEEAILQYLLNTLTEGKLIEKPTADLYYEEMQDLLNIANCSISQLKNKVRNMKKVYVKVREWREKEGQSVKETEGEEAFTALSLKTCPHFVMMDEIFGKMNIQCVMSAWRAAKQTPTKDKTENDASKQDDVAPENASADSSGNENVERLVEAAAAPESTGSSKARSATTLAAAKKKEARKRGADCLLTIARNKKIELDMKRLDLDNRRLKFEKEKLEREMELEKLRIENKYKISKYELELKYGVKYNTSVN